MRIAIIGPGAMGTLFAAHLSRSGNEVHLIDHDSARAAVITRTGIKLWEGDTLQQVPVKISTIEGVTGRFDLCLVMVKAPQTPQAARAALHLMDEDSVALTLQNGLGGGEILSKTLGEERVIAGVTAQGATLLGDGEVRHGGSGETVLGPVTGKSPDRPDIVRLFTEAGLAARWTPFVMTSIWKKLAANCGINAITALTGIRNGMIVETPEAADICAQAVRETVRVAKGCGIDLGDEEEVARWVLSVAEATGANRSSMGQDVDRRKPTEIDFINGAISREGERLGIQTPVNTILTRLIKTLEKENARPSGAAIN